MAAGMLGLNPELVEQMAARFNAEATKIEELISGLSGVISQNITANWNGPDATRFQGEWDGQLKGMLVQVKTALQDTATAARNNIQQQQQASS